MKYAVGRTKQTTVSLSNFLFGKIKVMELMISQDKDTFVQR